MLNTEGYYRDLRLLAQWFMTTKEVDNKKAEPVYDFAIDYGIDTIEIWDLLRNEIDNITQEIA